MPFASLGLAPELVRAVADEGYAHPTPIQSEADPLALAAAILSDRRNRHGKTAAFVLPSAAAVAGQARQRCGR